MSVNKLLVTGNTEELLRFQLQVFNVANPLEQRGDTVFYTVFQEHLPDLLEAAKKAGVTVQQRAEAQPYWPVVIQGRAPKWEEFPSTDEGAAIKHAKGEG